MTSRRRWEMVGLVALVVIVVTIPASRFLPPRDLVSAQMSDAAPTFVGGTSCRGCHQVEWDRWSDSDHDLAMAEATEETVLGDFNDAELVSHGITSRFKRSGDRFLVNTEGPDGEMTDFEIRYTFGYDPLQQYLVPFPGGRLQALPLAWDTIEERWFDLNPDRRIAHDDWLHWTRNAQNWNGMCAECHSTNLVKGYDVASNSYNTTWTDIDVGCEACHGPGSRHVDWAEITPMARPAINNVGLVITTSGIEGPVLVEQCAPCHARRAELADYDHSGSELLDSYLPALLSEGLYHPDGQILDEVYVYGSFLQSKMYLNGVSCRDCHDSHSLKLHQKGNDLCLQCHQAEIYDTSAHHFHKLEVQGTASPGASCVKCHMVEQPFMVNDWRADHSFRRPRPDLSSELGTPNACSQAGCHGDKPLSWSVEAYRRWYGQARRPSFASTFAAARTRNADAEPALIRMAANQLAPAIVRSTALDLLQHYPGPDVDTALRAAVMAPESLLRRTATAAISVADPQERANLLAPLLQDPIRAVRLAAASQLAGIDPGVLQPYQREALEAAIVEYRQAMTAALDFASSGLNLGNLEMSLGRTDEAEAYYRIALQVDDLFFPAKMNLAVLLSQQGQNDEAEKLLREVLEAYPDNSDAAYSLGLLLVELGQADEGVRWLRTAAAARPEEPRVHYNLGLLEQQLGHLEAAERELRATIELQPDGIDGLYALADLLVRSGRFEEADTIADRMISAHPDQRVGHDVKAFIQSELGSGP